jgi:hypothetical protein
VITFTAPASGGLAPLEFRWWLFDGVSWHVAREWSTSNTFTWAPSAANPNAAVGVWVRGSGTTAGADVTRGLAFPIVRPALTLSALTSSMASPQAPGTPITFTASTSGGTAPLEYRWWLFNGATWSIAREWSTASTFTWTPAAANPKAAVGVWVRSAGSAAEFEVTRSLVFPIVSAP